MKSILTRSFPKQYFRPYPIWSKVSEMKRAAQTNVRKESKME